jgi:hypothetical protein
LPCQPLILASRQCPYIAECAWAIATIHAIKAVTKAMQS